jgi:hypothetical protein
MPSVPCAGSGGNGAPLFELGQRSRLGTLCGRGCFGVCSTACGPRISPTYALVKAAGDLDVRAQDPGAVAADGVAVHRGHINRGQCRTGAQGFGEGGSDVVGEGGPTRRERLQDSRIVDRVSSTDIICACRSVV